jgi:thiol-disulfide isomerase/thioredoxin
MISKKIGYILLLFSLIGMTKTMYSQNSILVNFDSQYHLPQEDGNGFMKLLDCNGSDLINYDGNTYQIVFPDKFFVQDTAVAFNYFTGWKNAKIENATLFLFGNYSSHKPIMYVDYNHNLDFTDDGQPISFNHDSTAIVYLKNSEFPSSYFPIKFFYPKLELEAKNQIESIFSEMGPDVEGNNILSIDYWLGDIRMNYRISDTWINGRKFKIGLYDSDCNGLFNDKGKDRIMIGNYEKDSISGKLDKGAVIFSDSSQIEIGEQIYEIEEIEPSGQFIKLKKSQRIYNRPLNIGDEISDLKIKLISGETKTIKELQNQDKYLLLDFWGTWCKGCTQQLPFLNELKKSNNNKLQIIGLNFGDDFKKIEDYILKHNINWINGYADDNIIEKLRIDGFPNYLLLDKKGRIMIMNGTIDEIKKRL